MRSERSGGFSVGRDFSLEFQALESKTQLGPVDFWRNSTQTAPSFASMRPETGRLCDQLNVQALLQPGISVTRG